MMCVARSGHYLLTEFGVLLQPQLCCDNFGTAWDDTEHPTAQNQL